MRAATFPRREDAATAQRERSSRRVSQWLAATLEMSCRETGCGFESRALRFLISEIHVVLPPLEASPQKNKKKPSGCKKLLPNNFFLLNSWFALASGLFP